MEEWRRDEVRIADHVVAIIAGMAVQEVAGIKPVGGLYEDLSKRVSGKTVAKGVSVTVDEGKTIIDMRVMVEFGQRIDSACFALQKRVKEMVEMLTGLHVEAVNIRVDGIEPA